MSNKKIIAIIPARKGSKRLLRKNIQILGKIPLLAHSIIYFQDEIPNSDCFVSTDSDEIATIASEFGAKVLMRPEELATDIASTTSVLQHSVKELLNQGNIFDYIVLLQPTNPLRPTGLLKQAICTIESGEYDSLISVSPLHRKLGKIDNNQYIPWNYYFGQRSQEIEPLYYENGLLYITKKELILEGRIIGDNMFSLIVDHVFGTIDIDTKEDFELAEFYFNKGL